MTVVATPATPSLVTSYARAIGGTQAGCRTCRKPNLSGESEMKYDKELYIAIMNAAGLIIDMSGDALASPGQRRIE